MTFQDLVKWEAEQQIFASLYPGGDYAIDRHGQLYEVLHWARETIEEQRAEIARLRSAAALIGTLWAYNRG